ncbi:MAG: PPOX class F420-dependent oxidoreductase [Anaerolineae bacterium]
MSSDIPESAMDLLEKRAFAALGTMMADGSPQVTPVWVMYDAPYVIINSARGRVKDRNMRRDPHVALSIQDPDDPYRYLGIQGRVVEITEKGADDVIDQLAYKYLGKERYPGHSADETRVTYKIEVHNAWEG